jgi:hypothetical protein
VRTDEIAQNIQGRARHIAASFNVEKLVGRIPFHFRAEQQQQQYLDQQQHLAIPNTATTSQIYMTTTTHSNKDTPIEEQNT